MKLSIAGTFNRIVREHNANIVEYEGKLIFDLKRPHGYIVVFDSEITGTNCQLVVDDIKKAIISTDAVEVTVKSDVAADLQSARVAVHLHL